MGFGKSLGIVVAMLVTSLAAIVTAELVLGHYNPRASVKIEKQQKQEREHVFEHPLKEKLGFNFRGKLADEREFRYAVIESLEISRSLAEELVTVYSNGNTVGHIYDWNCDRKVDEVSFPDRKRIIRTESGFEYDDRVYKQEVVEDIFKSAQTIFDEVRSNSELEEKLRKHTSVSGNPFEVVTD